MAEIFSLVSAAAGLLDLTIKLVNYARDLKNGGATIQQELDSLIEKACLLEQVCNAVTQTYDRTITKRAKENTASSRHGQSTKAAHVLWHSLARMVSQCRHIVERVFHILDEICKPSQQTISKHVDVLVRAHRKRSKEDDLRRCQNELSTYHSSIQITLAIINCEEAQDSQANTAKSFKDLASQLGALQSHIFTLEESTRSTGDPEYDKEALSALRELKSSIDNATELIAPAAVNKHFETPQAVSSIFTGRESLLQELRDCFIQPSGPLRHQSQRRFVVYGLSGSGKTQFCCKFAEDNRERFWGVFSVDGSSVESIKKSFCNIAKRAGRNPSVTAALDWLSTVDERWLLLIDNADDFDVQLEDYFPKGVGGHILITTRNRDFSVLGNVEPRYYDFSGLHFDDASSLLLKATFLPRPWEASWETLASNITKALGHLALAIVHAGAAIRSRLCGLQDYLEWYKRYWEKLHDEHAQQNAADQEKAIWTTFELCYQRLEQKRNRPEAADAIELLHLFGFLHRDDLSPTILTKGLKNAQLEAEHEKAAAGEEAVNPARGKPKMSDMLRRRFTSLLMFMIGANAPLPLPSLLRDGRQAQGLEAAEDRIRRALSELEKMSLIYYNERRRTYTMHPVVHKWARDRPRMKLRYQALWATLAAQTLSASILLPPLGTSASDEMHHASLLPHIEHVRHLSLEISTKLHKRSSRSWLPEFLRTAGPTAGPVRVRVRTSAKFGLVYAQCGVLRQAEALLSEVSSALTTGLGAADPRTRAAQTALAAIYWELGRVDDALALQRGVVSACEAALGRAHPDTLRAVHRVAGTLWQQGRYGAARELQVEVVDGLKGVLGGRHVDVLEAMSDLGRTVMKFGREGDVLEAFELFSTALEGLRETVGGEHRVATFVKENLARVSCLIGDQALLHAALGLMEEVIATRRARMGKEAPWTLIARGNKAVVLGALGRAREAETTILDILAITRRDENVPENHIGVLFARQILATMLIQQERYEEAETILVDVIEKQRKMTSRSNDFHPDRIVSMTELGRCYERLGKLRDSIRICDEAIKGMEKSAKDGHPFLDILREARSKMNERLNDTQEGGSGFVPKTEIRFPEYLFKIYN